MAVCQKFGIESEVIPRIASGFGGGIGNTGAVCGAVVGAVMALSLKAEPGSSMEDWLRLASKVQEFRRRFEAEMGTINCRELTGQDLSNPESLEEALNSEVFQTVCAPAVGHAYHIVLDIIGE